MDKLLVIIIALSVLFIARTFVVVFFPPMVFLGIFVVLGISLWLFLRKRR